VAAAENKAVRSTSNTSALSLPASSSSQFQMDSQFQQALQQNRTTPAHTTPAHGAVADDMFVTPNEPRRPNFTEDPSVSGNDDNPQVFVLL
jgi:hypothetical protein